jgi:hypothetical protein
VEELVVEFLELGGDGALAGEEQGVGHFAEGEAERESGCREDRWAVQGGGQGFGELGVRDGSRRDNVEWASDVGIFQC